MEIDETTTEWRVSWTDPQGEKVRKGTEAEVKRIAQRNHEWEPVIESRVIMVGEWETNA